MYKKEVRHFDYLNNGYSRLRIGTDNGNEHRQQHGGYSVK